PRVTPAGKVPPSAPSRRTRRGPREVHGLPRGLIAYHRPVKAFILALIASFFVPRSANGRQGDTARTPLDRTAPRQLRWRRSNRFAYAGPPVERQQDQHHGGGRCRHRGERRSATSRAAPASPRPLSPWLTQASAQSPRRPVSGSSRPRRISSG